MHKEASASSIAIIYIPGFELLQSWSSSLKYLASNLLKLISSLLFLTFMSGKIFRLQPLQKNISLVYLPWWEALCSQLEFIDICTGPKRYLFNRNWSVSYSCNLFGRWFHHYIWQCRSLLSIFGRRTQVLYVLLRRHFKNYRLCFIPVLFHLLRQDQLSTLRRNCSKEVHPIV